jgi:hypothetical protein
MNRLYLLKKKKKLVSILTYYYWLGYNDILQVIKKKKNFKSLYRAYKLQVDQLTLKRKQHKQNINMASHSKIQLSLTKISYNSFVFFIGRYLNKLGTVINRYIYFLLIDPAEINYLQTLILISTLQNTIFPSLLNLNSDNNDTQLFLRNTVNKNQSIDFVKWQQKKQKYYKFLMFLYKYINFQDMHKYCQGTFNSDLFPVNIANFIANSYLNIKPQKNMLLSRFAGLPYNLSKQQNKLKEIIMHQFENDFNKRFNFNKLPRAIVRNNALDFSLEDKHYFRKQQWQRYLRHKRNLTKNSRQFILKKVKRNNFFFSLQDLVLAKKKNQVTIDFVLKNKRKQYSKLYSYALKRNNKYIIRSDFKKYAEFNLNLFYKKDLSLCNINEKMIRKTYIDYINNLMEKKNIFQTKLVVADLDKMRIKEKVNFSTIEYFSLKPSIYFLKKMPLYAVYKKQFLIENYQSLFLKRATNFLLFNDWIRKYDFLNNYQNYIINQGKKSNNIWFTRKKTPPKLIFNLIPTSRRMEGYKIQLFYVNSKQYNKSYQKLKNIEKFCYYGVTSTSKRFNVDHVRNDKIVTLLKNKNSADHNNSLYIFVDVISNIFSYKYKIAWFVIIKKIYAKFYGFDTFDPF